MHRDFKGIWLPRELYLAEDLSWNEKILLVEIDSLDRGEGCFASNRYLAEFIQLSVDRLAAIISGLRKRGYIIDVKTNGRRRWLRVNPAIKQQLKWKDVEEAEDSDGVENNTSDVLNSTRQPLWKQQATGLPKSSEHHPAQEVSQEVEVPSNTVSNKEENVRTDFRTVRDFRSWFANKHQERIGVKYKGDENRRENDIVRTLFKRFPLAKLHDLADLFLRTELWRGCRKQHTVGMMLYLINQGWPETPIREVASSSTKQAPETSEVEFRELSRRLAEERERFLRGEEVE